MSQSVTIIGPNLRDQSKGEFHVHAAGCADIARNARRDPEFANGWTIDAENLTEVCDNVYPPEDFECESGEYLSSFHVAPCVTIPASATGFAHCSGSSDGFHSMRPDETCRYCDAL